MNVDTSGLPPEMQQRIADIIEGAKAKAASVAETPHQAAAGVPAAGVTPPAAMVGQRNNVPVVRPQPSLMDHTVSLRQEVAALSQQVEAMGHVVEAVGQAVGQMYGMFQQQTTVTDPSATYSSQFQEYEQEPDY